MKNEGTAVIIEERSVLEKIRQWYSRKYIETGKSQKFEEKFHKSTDIQNKSVKFLGATANVISSVLSEDSKYKLAAEIVSDERVLNVKTIINNLLEKAVIGSKRYVEYNFFKVDGTSSQVQLPSENIIIDTLEAAKDIKDLENKYTAKKAA